MVQLEETVRSMVMRYGSRIWKLRVLQAEIKMTIRLANTNTRIPIRLFLCNESGYYLDITMYKEVTDERVGQVRTASFEHLQTEIIPNVRMIFCIRPNSVLSCTVQNQLNTHT